MSKRTAQKPGQLISSSGGSFLTVGDIRNAIAHLDNDVEVDFGTSNRGYDLLFFKIETMDGVNGEKTLHIELNEDDE